MPHLMLCNKPLDPMLALCICQTGLLVHEQMCVYICKQCPYHHPCVSAESEGHLKCVHILLMKISETFVRTCVFS